MKHRSRIKILVRLALTHGGHTAWAFQHPDHEELPDLDVRRTAPAVTNAPSAAHEAGVQRLKPHYADLGITRDDRQLRPNFVSRQNGFLTGPDGSGAVISKTMLNADSISNPHRVTKAFWNEHPGVFGHEAATLTDAVVKRDSVSRMSS